MKYKATALFLLLPLFSAYFPGTAFASQGSYVNVTSSRAFDTQYQNTGDDDQIIQVGILDLGGSGARLELQVATSTGGLGAGAVSVCETGAFGPIECNATAIVPAGSYYFALSGGSPNLTTWYEYTTASSSPSAPGEDPALTDEEVTTLVVNIVVSAALVGMFIGLWIAFFQRPRMR